MRRFINILTSTVICCMFSVMAHEHDRRGEIRKNELPVSKPHYQDEYLKEEVVDEEAWIGQTGLNAAFGSTDKLYFRREKPVVDLDASVFRTTVWKGERVNMQLLVWSSDTLEQVRVRLNELKKKNGQAITTDHYQFNLVRYVLASHPYATKNAHCDTNPFENGFMMPDRFEPFERFDLPGKTLRPIWLMLDVPASVSAGTYSGKIRIQSMQQSISLRIEINVQNQLLPQPGDWKHRLDLWQNPWVVAWHNHVAPWSDEHKILLKQHLKPYAEAGGAYITTYAVHSPWSDNSFRIEEGMIEWIRQKDRSWKFDYRIFDEYVTLAMECGINKAITIYTAIPWGNRFRYLDEITGNYIYESWEPGTEEFAKHWNIFLTDLRNHLKHKGWFDITYIGINENPMPQTLAAIRVVKTHSKDWKITYAGDWHKELDELLDDYSCLFGKEPLLNELQARKLRGASSTYYVCCNPPVPNNFLFSPPIEGRWISWYSAACGYDGFLRWAYDAWPEDPNRDARHGSWPAGDCFMIYPGGHSCIRFEKMREGIVEYEKIRILKEKALNSTNPKVKKLTSELKKLMEKIYKEKEFDETSIAADIQKGKELLNALSEETN